MSTTRHDLNAISELIETIYAAPLKPGGWEVALEAMAAYAPGTYAALHGHDNRINRNIGYINRGYSPEMVEQYAAYFGERNCWVPGTARSPIGKATAAEVMCPKEDLIGTEFYNDWIVPQEDIGTGGGLVLFRDAERMIAISGNIRFKDQDKLQQRWLEMLDIVSPHLRQAFEIQRQLLGRQLENGLYREALETPDTAVFLIARNGRIAHMNKAAGSLLENRRVLYLDPWRTLRAQDRDADRILTAALAAISDGRVGGLYNTSLRSPDRPDPYLARIVPFRPSAEQTDITAEFLAFELPVALLTVVDPTRDRHPIRDALQTHYRLTPAEIRLAEALFRGETLREFAEARGRSFNTVRNQLKSVFAKTGINRQSELVALIARLARR